MRDLLGEDGAVGSVLAGATYVPIESTITEDLCSTVVCIIYL